MTFKATNGTGVLLYNGYRPPARASRGSGSWFRPRGDFFSLNLDDGYVDFRFDLGTGPAIIRSGQPIKLHRWHHVTVSRTGRQGWLLDGGSPKEGVSMGAYVQMSLTDAMYVGGVVPDVKDMTAKHSNVKANFQGCIQKLSINHQPVDLVEKAIHGTNIGDCHHPCQAEPCGLIGRCRPHNETFACDCALAHTGTTCTSPVRLPIYAAKFKGDGYLAYEKVGILRRIGGNRNHIEIRFRSWSSSGLILWSGAKDKTGRTSDFIAVAIVNGYVEFRYNLGSGEVVITQSAVRVDDGQWHSLRAIRSDRDGTLTVDDGPPKTGRSPGLLQQVNIADVTTEATPSGRMYVGGAADMKATTEGRYPMGISGCVSHLTLATDYHVLLSDEAVNGWNVEPCPS